MEIDWSKTPEGATHWDPIDENWLRQFSGVALGWLNDRGWSHKGWQYPDDLSSMDRLIARPAWSGKGLPPVGTVCEVQKDAGFDWTTTKVLAHHLGFAVHSWSQDGDDMEVAAAPAGEFRPIHTANQIADDQHDTEFEEIRTVMAMFDDFRDAAQELLDRGYRKQVQP